MEDADEVTALRTPLVVVLTVLLQLIPEVLGGEVAEFTLAIEVRKLVLFCRLPEDT